MNIVVAGSLAKDIVMSFEGRFEDYILPDSLHMLNISFLADDMKECFGGTAGNICYNMAVINTPCAVLAKVGGDGEEYVDYLQEKQIDTDLVVYHLSENTARAHVLSDMMNNQLTAFYPGASAAGDDAKIPYTHPYDLLLVAPTRKKDMISLIRQAITDKKKFIFDPGQMTPYFEVEEWNELLPASELLIGNEYEIKLIAEKLNCTEEALNDRVKRLITTKGVKGSVLVENGKETLVEAVKNIEVKDPTGAGDAYRAGLLWAYYYTQSLVKGMRLGSILSSFSIEHHETQSHSPTKDDIMLRYQNTYNSKLSL